MNLALESGIDEQGPQVTLILKLSGQRLRFSRAQALKVANGMLTHVVALEDEIQRQMAVEAMAQQAAIVTPPAARITDTKGKPIV